MFDKLKSRLKSAPLSVWWIFVVLVVGGYIGCAYGYHDLRLVLSNTPLRYVVGTVIGITAAAISVFFIKDQSDWTRALVLGLWMVATPGLFFVEWYMTASQSAKDAGVVAKTKPVTEPEEKSKAPEYGEKFWVAISAFLTLLYFGEYVKHVSKESLADIDTRLARAEQRLALTRDDTPRPDNADQCKLEMWQIYSRLKRIEEGLPGEPGNPGLGIREK